jgi:hypothetical protein
MNDPQKLAHAVAVRHVCLQCADIPDVQKHINLLESALLKQYEENVEEAMTLVAMDLDDLIETEDDDDELFLLGALWLSTVAALSPVDTDIEGAARLSGRALVRGGANAARSGPFTGGAYLRELARPSAGDLLFWFRRAAVEDARIEAVFKGAAAAWLDAGDFSSASRLSLLKNLREILLRGRGSLRNAVDTWGYRWYNIGLFEGQVSALRTAEVIVAFNNPPMGPDRRTTPFCRSVHGRVLSVTHVRAQMASYLSAIAVGDATAAKAAWRLRSGEEALRASPPTANIGLPPYHFRCRTVTRAARGA